VIPNKINGPVYSRMKWRQRSLLSKISHKWIKSQGPFSTSMVFDFDLGLPFSPQSLKSEVVFVIFELQK